VSFFSLTANGCRVCEVAKKIFAKQRNFFCNFANPQLCEVRGEASHFEQRKSIYEEGELKAQKFNLPQKPIKSTLVQI
jgi:hypothetical protein